MNEVFRQDGCELKLRSASHVVAFVSHIEPNPDEDYDDWAGMTVSKEGSPGETLFEIDDTAGDGDYRGFPACIYATPSWELEEWYDLEQMGIEDDHSFGQLIKLYNNDETQAFRFVLNDTGEGEGHDRYEFVCWLTPSGLDGGDIEDQERYDESA